MVKTSRTAATQTPRGVTKKKPYNSSKKSIRGAGIASRIAIAKFQKGHIAKGHKEYRLVVFFNDVKHQGPRLCFKGAKLYFSPEARLLLGVWTHDSHFLPPNYSACVTGYTNKNIAHAVTYSMVRNQVSSMLSKSLFNASLDTLDLLVSTSTKTDQVSPNNKHKTIPLLGNKNSK